MITAYPVSVFLQKTMRAMPEIIGKTLNLIRKIKADVILERDVWLCRRHYPRAMERVRDNARENDKLTVLFVVTEPAKWKTQSLYDAMIKSERYLPVICVSRPDSARCLTSSECRVVLDESVQFFVSRGMTVRKAYDFSSGAVDLRIFKPDIVFYQQAWFSVRGQMPVDVSRTALTCYIPYFVPNYGDLILDCQLPLHRMVYLNIVLNENWAELYRDAGRSKSYAGRFVGLGHTMLDEIEFDKQCGDDKNYVIYAPHWTINPEHRPDNLSYSTFLWNGREILEYARMHREIKWIFKPHPNLRSILVRFGVMCEQEVSAYYDAWGKIGTVELSAGYEQSFAKSFAMITDCGSFLTEYAATGKPIIHLISSENRHVPQASSKALYATYYQVHDLQELKSTFKMVLEDRTDPNRQKRLEKLRESGLCGHNAAQAVLNYFEREFFDEGKMT